MKAIQYKSSGRPPVPCSGLLIESSKCSVSLEPSIQIKMFNRSSVSQLLGASWQSAEGDLCLRLLHAQVKSRPICKAGHRVGPKSC